MTSETAAVAPPLDDLFEPAKNSTSSTFTWSPQAKPLEGRRTLSRIACYTRIATDLTLILLFAMESAVFAVIHDQQALRSPPIQIAATASGIISQFIQPVTIAVVVFNILCYVMFVHRASKNLRLLKARGLDVSPGGAVGWSFVPFANLWQIPHIMRQIWRASTNPIKPPQDVPTIFNVWWTTWVIAGFLGTASNLLSKGLTGLPPEQIAEQFAPVAITTCAGLVLSTVATICLLNIIKQVTGLQRDLRETSAFS